MFDTDAFSMSKLYSLLAFTITIFNEIFTEFQLRVDGIGHFADLLRDLGNNFLEFPEL